MALCVSQTLCQCAAMTPLCQDRLQRFSQDMAWAPTLHQGLNVQVGTSVLSYLKPSTEI